MREVSQYVQKPIRSDLSFKLSLKLFDPQALTFPITPQDVTDEIVLCRNSLKDLQSSCNITKTWNSPPCSTWYHQGIQKIQALRWSGFTCGK